MAIIESTYSYKVSIPKYVSSKPYYLGLAEKPSAAKIIASVLDPKSKKINIKVSRKTGKQKLPDTTAYLVKIKNIHILIIPALGHLFTLNQDGVGWQYPVYDFKWVPTHLARRNKFFSKFDLRIESAIEAIRYLAKNSSDFLIMTDYDEEGEVIGGVLLTELVGKEILQKVKRMKFSSFAKKELIQSLENALNGTKINFGMYNRGLMRHYLDWLWGINLSRALMLSLKNTSGQYLTLSTGRVQGPTLSFVSDRQQEINSHVPLPSFKINLLIQAKERHQLDYSKGNLQEEIKAKKIIKATKAKIAIVNDVKSTSRRQTPPSPFNLSSLQNDAYRFHKISPSRTLQASEKLYLGALISYPRTSSEKYPSDLNHNEIKTELTKQTRFTKYHKKMATTKKQPNEGRKTDSAHPCIYPTGIKPGQLKGDAERIYLLIVHRYFSTFGTPSEIQYNRINFEINNELFHMSGKRTVRKGWKELAGPYGKSEENDLPNFSPGDSFSVAESNYKEIFSKNPPYYNQSSLLKRMEKEMIGTKATRSEIIRSLFDRKYLKGDPIEITPVGEIVNQVLLTYSSQVISVELSRKLDLMGDMIEQSINEGKTTFSLADAIVQGVIYLHEMLNNLQENEILVGKLIGKELRSQRLSAKEVGDCKVCKIGKLKILHSQSSGKRFVGCSEYFNNKNCTVTFPLPQKGRLEPLSKLCKADGYPQIKVFSGKRPWNLCLNPECPLRKKFKNPNKKKVVNNERM